MRGYWQYRPGAREGAFPSRETRRDTGASPSRTRRAPSRDPLPAHPGVATGRTTVNSFERRLRATAPPHSKPKRDLPDGSGPSPAFLHTVYRQRTGGRIPAQCRKLSPEREFASRLRLVHRSNPTAQKEQGEGVESCFPIGLSNVTSRRRQTI